MAAIPHSRLMTIGRTYEAIEDIRGEGTDVESDPTKDLLCVIRWVPANSSSRGRKTFVVKNW